MPKFWASIAGRFRSVSAVVPHRGPLLTARIRQTRSGRDFSTPYEAITPTVPGYSYRALLNSAIKRSAQDDLSDYGEDTSDGCDGGASDSDYDGSSATNGGSDSEDDRMRTSDSDGDPAAPPVDPPRPRLFITIPPRPHLHLAPAPNAASRAAPAPTKNGREPMCTTQLRAAPNAPSAVPGTADGAAPTPNMPRKKKRRSARAVALQKLRSKQSRKAKQKLQASHTYARPKRALQARSVRGSSPLAAPFKMADKRVAKTAYVGLRDPKPTPSADPAPNPDHGCESDDSGHEFESDPGSEVDSEGSEFDSEGEPGEPGREARAYTAKEMVDGHGFGYMRWDGKVPRPLTDDSGHVVANLLGAPGDPSWEGVHKRATELLRQAGGRIRCTAKDTYHRRGDFKALAQGIRYGTGMKRPGNAKNTKHNGRILSSVMQSEEITRVVGFINSCFHTWAPRLHKHYGDMMAALCAHHPHLRRNFAEGESVFACTTINFGPATECFPHTDNNNLAWGWCAVTALGNYDPTLGGHLILWDLKLIVEFPPGSTVLIPSAVFTHSNTAIQEGETRYSFTQYTSGGLFRWVDHGFRGEKAFNASLSGRGRREEEKSKAGRWMRGMKMYSTIDELNKLYK